MRKIRSNFRNRFELACYRLARATVGRGGPGLIEPVGTLLGGLFHRVAVRRGRIIRYNLRLAFPEMSDSERDRLALKVGQHFGRALLGTLRLQRMAPDQLRRLVTVEGEEHIRSIVDNGKGVFFLSAHLGAWEVAALYVGLTLPGGIGVVHRPLDNPLLEAELEDYRRLYGNRTLGKDAALRAMLSEIKQGRSIGILIDQKTRPKDGGELVPFFDHPARTHLILARVVLKTGTPVYPIHVYAEPGGRFTLVLDPPVPVEDGDDEISLTARYTAATEAAIRRRPEQWLWYHDRWRELRQEEESST